MNNKYSTFKKYCENKCKLVSNYLTIIIKISFFYIYYSFIRISFIINFFMRVIMILIILNVLIFLKQYQGL